MAPGGGFGALDTLNKTLKNNARLLKKVRVFDRIKGYSNALKGRTYQNTKQATPEQLAEIRAKALVENRKALFRQILKIVVSIIILAALGAIFIWGAMSRGGS